MELLAAGIIVGVVFGLAFLGLMAALNSADRNDGDE